MPYVTQLWKADHVAQSFVVALGEFSVFCDTRAKIFFLHQKGWGILQQVSDLISRVELHLLQRYERSNESMSATASFSAVI